MAQKIQSPQKQIQRRLRAGALGYGTRLPLGHWRISLTGLQSDPCEHPRIDNFISNPEIAFFLILKLTWGLI